MVCRGLEVLKWAGDDVQGARDDGTGAGYDAKWAIDGVKGG
jgi:hypothetical protein